MKVNIRAARRNMGWTLTDAASRFDISVSALSMIERGQRVPSPPLALRIAESYGHTVTDIWPEPEPEDVAA